MTESENESGGVKLPRRKATGSHASSQALTSLQLDDLACLERVVSLHRSYEEDPAKELWLLQAINRAVYSAYIDCIEHGIGERARALLPEEPNTNPVGDRS